MPTHTYRASAYLAAAGRLGIGLLIGSDRKQALSDHAPGRTIALDFAEPDAAAQSVRAAVGARPLAGIVATDDDTVVLAAQLAARLGVNGNTVESAGATRDKRRMRELLAARWVPSPAFRIFPIGIEPGEAAREVRYPCVLKPVCLSASRGVIRSNDPEEFALAYTRIRSILADPVIHMREGEAAEAVLVEDYVDGVEVAVEGLIEDGVLRVLAIFDKPDPLEGPFFEETLYVTPSVLPDGRQAEIERVARDGAAALGLRTGAVHAELRLEASGPAVLIEMAARSIGGLCSRSLRFIEERTACSPDRVLPALAQSISLEELILRQAAGLPTRAWRRESAATGVLMIPIPRPGVLEEVAGGAAACSVAGIEDLVVSIPAGQRVVPLPEGDRYLGFLFARGETPTAVEEALRAAHSRLEIRIRPE